MKSFLPRTRRDRVLLAVGTTIATAAVIAACGDSSNTEGPVGNLAAPDTGVDADVGDSVFNVDGPVGNTALPADTARDDTAGDATDATDTPATDASDAADGTSDADGG